MGKPSTVKTVIKAALLLAAILVIATSCIQQAKKIDVPITSAETPEPLAVKVSDSTFKAFSHDVTEHKQFDCVACHRREGKSRELAYTGHESCVGCHLNQFISNEVTDQNRAMCSICHSTLDSADPPLKEFPTKFLEGFNMKFDHAAHSRGEGRPAQGCAACHRPAGPGQTIPSGIASHANCYGCHTAESKIGSCNNCHQLGPYRRTLPSQYGFKAIFRHGDHTSRQGVSCDECHSVRSGVAQAQQVTNISILQHRTSPGNNCLQCHNGKRAFTGNNPFDVGTCTRCHTGSGFGSLPPGSFSE